MPFDPEKLKQAQGRAQASTPMTSQQASSTFSAEKLKAAQEGGLNMDREAAIRRTLKQSALPVAGQLLGTGLGLATGPAAPLAVPMLEASLGMAGEGLNQALGITEEDPKQLLLQGAVPFGMRLLGAAARPLREITPPTTRGAEFLNRIAAPEARSRLAQFAAPASEALFQRAFTSGARFDTGNTVQTIRGALADLQRGPNGEALYGRTIGILKDLESRLTQTGGQLDPRTYQAVLRDLGAAQRSAEGRTLNQVEKGAIQSVYGKLAQALDRESIPRRGPAGGEFVEHEPAAINPDIIPDETSTALTVPRRQGPLDRGMQTGTPLQPNVPSTRVILPGMQPNQPVPFTAGVPGVRQADEIIPAPQSPGRSGPDIRVSPVDEPQPAPSASAQAGGTTGNRNAMAAQDLLQARQYIKRQAVLDEIEESVAKAEKVLRGQGENVQFNAAAVLRDLKKNPFWNGTKGERNPAFTAGEKKEIEQIFTLLNTIPALRPGAGVSAGSFQIARALKSGAIAGGGTTAATGGDPVLSGAATAIGASIPTMVEFGRVLNIALRTEAGRRELMNELRKPGASLATITNAFLGAGVASTATPGRIQRPLTSMPVPFAMEP